MYARISRIFLYPLIISLFQLYVYARAFLSQSKKSMEIGKYFEISEIKLNGFYLISDVSKNVNTKIEFEFF